MVGFGFSRAVAFCALAGTLLIAAPALAAPADDARTCSQSSGEEAITACDRAIASGRYKGKDLAGIYYNRGIEYFNKADYDQAISDYNEAIRLDPKYSLAFNNRGNAYYKKKDYERAISDYNNAMQYDPKLALPYYNRGLVYDDKNDYEKALADYTKAIQLDPKYTKALNNRGYLYFTRKDYQRAISDYSTAVDVDPKYWLAVRNRGVAYYLTEKYDLAIADFDTSGRINTKAAYALYGRGLAKLKKGDTAGGNADIAAAKAIEGDIVDQWSRDFGITIPAVVTAPVPAPTPASSPSSSSTPSSGNCERAELHWKSAEDIRSVEVYEDHLKRFPNCDFAGLARARIQALRNK